MCVSVVCVSIVCMRTMPVFLVFLVSVLDSVWCVCGYGCVYMYVFVHGVCVMCVSVVYVSTVLMRTMPMFLVFFVSVLDSVWCVCV